jgi:AraC-like DNA-binding protein
MNREKIKEICVNYYNVTGLTTFYITSALEVTEISKGFTLDQLSILDLDEVLNCIQLRYKNKLFTPNTFVTCSTKNQYIYNLAYIKWANGDDGIFISGVMTITPINDLHINTLFEACKVSISRSKFMKIISEIMTVSYLRINNLGKNLLALINTVSGEIPIKQVFHEDALLNKQMEDHIDNLAEYQLSSKIGEHPEIPSDIYQKLKTLVTTGDVEGMKYFTSTLEFTVVDQLVKNDTMHSIKASCVAAAVLGFTFAMDVNAPYYKLYSITLSFFNQIDNLNTAIELRLLLKNILLSYTKIVSLTSFPSYSRPVKMAIQFIQKNYYRKITLPELAHYTDISPYYLSTLIKKETSLSLTDNINKIRVEASKYLLLNTDLTILEIAQNTGFIYQNHFSSVFKKLAGVNPTEFRSKRDEKQASE